MSIPGLKATLGERMLDGREDDVVKAMEESNGIIAIAAIRLGCHRETLSEFIRDRPAVKERCMAIRQANIDYVEGKLFQAIKKDDIRAVTFFLQTIGKDRGYAMRTELTGEDGGPIRHEVAAPPASKVLELFAAIRKEAVDATTEYLTNGHGNGTNGHTAPNGHDPAEGGGEAEDT